MRALLGSLTLLAAVIAGCGDDDGDGESDATEASDAPRLSCPGEIKSFMVAGSPVGVEEETHASADGAAQADVDRRDDLESYEEIGDDDDGVRYALLDDSGTVVEEAVYSDADGSWKPVQYDSCI